MKNMNLFKVAFAIFLTSILAVGCIPIDNNPPIPTDAGTAFNVNVQHLTDNVLPDSMDVVIDGDTISFIIFEVHFFTISTFLVITTHAQDYEILTSNKYWYNYSTNQYDSTSIVPPTNEINTFKAGILVDSNYTANTWKPFVPVENNLFGMAAFLFQTTEVSPDLYNGLQHNTDEYIVLRKPKNSGYQYYWIRARAEGNYTNPLAFTIKILNGKYKMNAITTGQ